MGIDDHESGTDSRGLFQALIFFVGDVDIFTSDDFVRHLGLSDPFESLAIGHVWVDPCLTEKHDAGEETRLFFITKGVVDPHLFPVPDQSV